MTLLDIGVDNSYPSAQLSNFYNHNFVVDDVICHSMEGFLQSLKCNNIETQKNICKLYGKKAKFKGKKYKWFENQELYWLGNKYNRASKEYQQLLNKAFNALFLNKEFKDALSASSGMKLNHSIGKNDISLTVLTKDEFLSRLTKLRNGIFLEIMEIK